MIIISLQLHFNIFLDFVNTTIHSNHSQLTQVKITNFNYFIKSGLFKKKYLYWQ